MAMGSDHTAVIAKVITALEAGCIYYADDDQVYLACYQFEAHEAKLGWLSHGRCLT